MQPIRYIDRKTQEVIEEHPPGEGILRFLYHNPLGKIPLELLIKRKLFTQYYGWKLSRPASKKEIRPFVEKRKINMSEYIKSIDEFESFNDFFYRELKPSARPIEEGLVSPADGKLLAFQHVSDVKKFYIKGAEFTLSSFLQNDLLAQKFEGGSMIVIRLAPNDYHRYHFPYGGIAAEPNQIRGYYYSVSPIAVMRDLVRVFCENKRSYTLLETGDKGDMLICPVGATMVGSIISTYRANEHVAKGDEMGYFAFGGSTIVLLAEDGQINISQDLLDNTNNKLETAVLMGQQIAK